MTAYRPTMAEAQAIGLCWLARASGLPEVLPNLRVSVVQLHTTACGWCEYPLPELVTMLRDFNSHRFIDDASERSEQAWWALPPKAKRAAIKAAQGNPA